eukprot:9465215-Lingulodinium_polyedra.AAC.1
MRGRGSAGSRVSRQRGGHELAAAELAGALPIAARMAGSFCWLFCQSLALDSRAAFPVGDAPFQSTKAAQVSRMPRMSS